jgi:cis-zeatin O-glucosyltransferase
MVRPWDKHGVVTPADVIREVMEKAMGSEEGLAIQEGAKAIRKSISASMAEGGSSRKDFDDFFAYITRRVD